MKFKFNLISILLIMSSQLAVGQFLVDDQIQFEAPMVDGDGYTWDFNDGSSMVTSSQQMVTHTYSSPGTYHIQLISNYNCLSGAFNDTILDTIYVETDFNDHISYGPNPGSGSMSINLTIPYSLASSAVVRNSLGNVTEVLMDGSTYTPNTYNYLISGYSPGTYYLEWSIENQTYSFPLVIN